MAVDLSIIVSTYNGLEKLKVCLAAYKNQAFTNFEIIVASDGSSDGTIEYVKNNKHLYPYTLRYVYHEKQGFRQARIRNCGWRIAEANRVIFTDHDLVPNADCLAHYSVYANQEGALAGYIGWIDPQVHIAFTEDSVWRIKNFEPFMTEPEKRDLQKYNFWVIWGGNASFSKKIYEETGGFDEEFTGWGGEDTDLSLRCERMGYLIKTVPEAKMFHLNHPPSNSSKRPNGSDLFFQTKQHDMSIKRNLNVTYEDVMYG